MTRGIALTLIHERSDSTPGRENSTPATPWIRASAHLALTHYRPVTLREAIRLVRAEVSSRFPRNWIEQRKRPGGATAVL